MVTRATCHHCWSQAGENIAVPARRRPFHPRSKRHGSGARVRWRERDMGGSWRIREGHAGQGPRGGHAGVRRARRRGPRRCRHRRRRRDADRPRCAAVRPRLQHAERRPRRLHRHPAPPTRAQLAPPRSRRRGGQARTGQRGRRRVRRGAADVGLLPRRPAERLRAGHGGVEREARAHRPDHCHRRRLQRPHSGLEPRRLAPASPAPRSRRCAARRPRQAARRSGR